MAPKLVDMWVKNCSGEISVGVSFDNHCMYESVLRFPYDRHNVAEALQGLAKMILRDPHLSGMLPLADLPNTEGFRFIGITKLGNRMPCIVARSEGKFRAMDCGTGEPIYNNLIGWEKRDDRTY